MLFKRKGSILIILIVILTISLMGCSNSAYEKFRNDFRQSYFNVASTLDLKDTPGSLKKLNSDSNQKQIKKMNNLLENIKSQVPSGLEKDYQQYTVWYEEMASLQGKAPKWNNLSSEEKIQIYYKLINIQMRKDRIKNNK